MLARLVLGFLAHQRHDVVMRVPRVPWLRARSARIFSA
jgi:hypothetical protein